MKDKTIYAYYKGGELLLTGTAEELAERTGVERHTIIYYATPSHKKRASWDGTLVERISSGVYEHNEVNCDKIHSLMEERDYSRKEMADILDMETYNFNRKLRRRGRFKKSEIEEMADLFFVDVEDLLTEKGKEEAK